MEKRSTTVMRDKFELGSLVTKNSLKYHVTMKKTNTALKGGGIKK